MPTRMMLMMLVAVASLAACNGYTLPFDVSLKPAQVQRDMDSPASIRDADSLAIALSTGGASVRVGSPVEQPLLSVPGRVLRVADADVQVYEYASETDALADARRIAPDASAAYSDSAVTRVHWADAPHFYRIGRLIVVYVGRDESLLRTLEAALGAPFAGI